MESGSANVFIIDSEVLTLYNFLGAETFALDSLRANPTWFNHFIRRRNIIIYNVTVYPAISDIVAIIKSVNTNHLELPHA